MERGILGPKKNTFQLLQCHPRPSTPNYQPINQPRHQGRAWCFHQDAALDSNSSASRALDSWANFLQLMGWVQLKILSKWGRDLNKKKMTQKEGLVLVENPAIFRECTNLGMVGHLIMLIDPLPCCYIEYWITGMHSPELTFSEALKPSAGHSLDLRPYPPLSTPLFHPKIHLWLMSLLVLFCLPSGFLNQFPAVLCRQPLTSLDRCCFFWR